MSDTNAAKLLSTRDVIHMDFDSGERGSMEYDGIQRRECRFRLRVACGFRLPSIAKLFTKSQ